MKILTKNEKKLGAMKKMKKMKKKRGVDSLHTTLSTSENP